MPELAELKFTSDYVNQVSEGMTYIGVKKNPIHKCEDIDQEYFNNQEFTITNDWIASKSGWTPYDNVKVKGFPIFTIVNGKVVMRENQITSFSS